MHSSSRVACAILSVMLMPVAALAQGAPAACPGLPADAGLHWEQLQGAGFVFCRALRGDGGEAFAVTLSGDSPFEPNRRNRAEEGSVGGHGAWWYRSEIAGKEDVIARETLVELGDGRLAHVTLRAGDEAQLQATMAQVGALRFGGAVDARLGSN